MHLAAIPRPTFDLPEVVFRTNVMSTFNVLEAASALGAQPGRHRLERLRARLSVLRAAIGAGVCADRRSDTRCCRRTPTRSRSSSARNWRQGTRDGAGSAWSASASPGSTRRRRSPRNSTALVGPGGGGGESVELHRYARRRGGDAPRAGDGDRRPRGVFHCRRELVHASAVARRWWLISFPQRSFATAWGTMSRCSARRRRKTCLAFGRGTAGERTGSNPESP